MNGVRTIPFNDSQMGIYLDCIDSKDSLKYNIIFEYIFDLGTDVDRLKNACDKVFGHYAAFRCGVDVVEGSPVLVVTDKTPRTEIVDVSEADYPELKKHFAKPFSFDGSLLVNAVLARTEEHTYLLTDIHHLIYDGTSTNIFENALKMAYQGCEIPEETVDRSDARDMQESYDFFDSLLSGVDVDSNLLPDKSGADMSHCSSTRFEMSAGIDRVNEFAVSHGATKNVVMLAAFTYALAKHTGQNEALFTSINSGRRGLNLDNTIGFFVRTFPLYYAVDEESGVDDYIAYIRRNYLDTMTHSDVPFTELASRYGVRSDIKYVYQGAMLQNFEVDGHSVVKTFQECDDALSNLDVMIEEDGGAFSVRFTYRDAMYSEENILAFARLFDCVLTGLMNCGRLRDIQLVSERDRAFVERFNSTETPYDESQSVWDILSENIRKYPSKPAVFFNGKAMTYAELDAITAKLAAFIRHKNIGTDDFVSVLIPRNEFMAMTAWGIVRAGAAYQPLDPTYPKDRLNFMVKDCGAKLVIADRALAGVLDEYEGDVLYTDEIEQLPMTDLSGGHFDTPSSALVIIYTSGTTGTPKGCVLENRNIVCFHHNHARNIGLDADSRVATYASFGFDAGVMDIFTTLMAGATLYVIPDELRLDMSGMDGFFRENLVTHAFMTTQVGRMFAQLTTCDTLKTLLVGGEKLVPFEAPVRFNFVNGYGPSETIAYVCHHVVNDTSGIQPIGTPSGNTKLYVMDKYCRMLPPGACGELGIAGGQVGRGYLGRPEKTAESFIENPFDSVYTRLYRTGDIVRLLPAGELDFVGRRDGQVKIRGFRVELTEVEQVIRSNPAINDATVTAYDLPSGGKYIAAYVTSDGAIDVNALGNYIRQTKPDYMVPEVIMQIDGIPLTANGKVDRRKLPAPQRNTEALVMPVNETQQRIFDIAAEVMGNRDFGTGTDLFTAGLSSIGVIRLNVLLAKAFDVSLTIRDLKDSPTVLGLEKLIEQKAVNVIDSDNGDTLQTGVDAQNGDGTAKDSYPLTKTQEGIYIECISAPGSTNYNIPLLLKIDGRIDVGRLKEAIAAAVEAHGYIKGRIFTDETGTARIRRCDGETFSAEDVEEITAGSIDDVKNTLMRPYNIVGDRLFRFTVICADGLYLYVDMHHIISDGTSVNIFLSDVSRAYEGQKLAGETFTGFDLAEHEQTIRTEEAIADAKAHYDAYLADADADFLPGGDLYVDSAKDSGSFSYISRAGHAENARRFCNGNSLSMNALLMSVFGLVLARFNAEDYAVFTTVYNGRNDSRTAEMVSMLVRTLPVYVNTQGRTAAALVREVSDRFMDCMGDDALSFADISRMYDIRADIMMIYQGSEFGCASLCGFDAEEIEIEMTDKKAPLSVQIFDRGDEFEYRTDYDSGRYSEALVMSIVRAFDHALGEFVEGEAAGVRPVSEITLADEETLAQMDALNRTEYEFDESRTMAGWFEKTATANEDRIAVECEGREYTYGKILDLSARVAGYLKSKGIGRGDFVPVLVERNEYMIIGTEGVIRAGAAYEPLDPAYPVERLKFMAEDAEAKIAIADRSLKHIADGLGIEVLYTDEIAGLPAQPGFTTGARPEDPFVIIYTSGTTGLPKGNVLAHRNPVALFDFHIRDAQLDSDSSTAYYTGFSFDAGMLDLHASLLSGGTLHIIPENLRLNLGGLDEFFNRHGITHSSMTTQMGSMFVKMTTCRTLRYFTAGGEKLVPFTPPEGIRFVNGYGPSECTIYSSGYDVRNDAALQPIGRPNANLKYYIVDKYGHRLPFGAAGELCIAGKQVGCGYRNRPEKNAESFTANVFTDEKGYERLYHTGDIIRELTDGNYDFIGRRDGQVKIRGFRVELAEIEQAVRAFEGINNATVQAYDDPAGGKYIAAFVVSDSKVDFDELGRFIGQTKPSYMVPSAYAQLDAIPLTPNGKVDKRALSAPPRNVSAKAGAEPANETEELFCDIFAEVLGLDKVYADDDFFAIGGSSIKAAQAVVKCDAAGYNIVFKNLFENPTPQKLAQFTSGAVGRDILAPSGEEKAKYDYSCLDYNIQENLPNIRRGGLGNVLLTGVTGFLGSHVYKALMEMTDSRVICLVRSKNGLDSQHRFEMIMNYYFEDWYGEQQALRTTVVDGDLEDEKVENILADLTFDTIINNAANVKHFAEGDNLMRGNFSSVEHLIGIAERRNAKLIQASSLSVCGESVNGSIPTDFKFREFNLNIGQSLENKYVHSKYLAEQAIVDAVSRGRIRGKIIRLGNLAARASDGEFQINPSNSGLLKLMQGYIKLGCYPVDAMDATIEFSPIDKVAEAMVLLAGTPDGFTVFHAKNCNEIHYGYLINALREKGHRIDIVERDEFEERFKKALETEEDITAFTGFIAYLNRTDSSVTDMMVYNNDDSNSKEAVKECTYETRIKVSSDTAFTTKALYRLGFAWPITGADYLDNMVGMLDDKAFF